MKLVKEILTILTLWVIFGILNLVLSTNTEELAMKFRHKKFKSHKKSKKWLQSPPADQVSINAESNLGKQLYQKNEPVDLSDLALGEGPIFWEGWIKYFKFQSIETGTRPKAFYKNIAFEDQRRKFPNANLDEKVNGVHKYITSDTSFYSYLFEDRLNIMTSKLNDYQTTFDIMLIDLITPLLEDNSSYSHGIQDFGAFVEGFCFKIESSPVILRQIPKTRENLTTWIFCTDNPNDKVKFMSFLRRLKLKRQRMAGIFLQTAVEKQETLQEMISPKKDEPHNDTTTTSPYKDENDTISYNTNNHIIDGYWIVLQDWTQCSLKCGGGTSTLQRMCVPPKNGGKACDGSSIVTKPCNIQPCPEVKVLKDALKNNETIKKPIVKIIPFSNRPQRYE